MRSSRLTGGVDTHLDVHVAGALDAIGGVLGMESFPADGSGYQQHLKCLRSFATVTVVGVERRKATAPDLPVTSTTRTCAPSKWTARQIGSARRHRGRSSGPGQGCCDEWWNPPAAGGSVTLGSIEPYSSWALI